MRSSPALNPSDLRVAFSCPFGRSHGIGAPRAVAYDHARFNLLQIEKEDRPCVSFRPPTRAPRPCDGGALTTLAGCGSGISLDEPIEGPAWRLAQLGDEPIAPGGEAQVQFDRGSGRVSGSGGCNRISGSFTRSGITLKIGQMASTRMACPTRRAAPTRRSSFGVAKHRELPPGRPGRLALLDASGRTVALLNAAAAEMKKTGLGRWRQGPLPPISP
jgi:hypothetical protein